MTTDTEEVRLKRLDKAQSLVDSLGKPGEWSFPERMKAFDLAIRCINYLPPEGEPDEPWPDVVGHPRVASVAVAIAGAMIENVLMAMKAIDNGRNVRGKKLTGPGRKAWDSCVSDLEKAGDLIVKQIEDGGFFDHQRAVAIGVLDELIKRIFSGSGKEAKGDA